MECFVCCINSVTLLCAFNGYHNFAFNYFNYFNIRMHCKYIPWNILYVALNTQRSVFTVGYLHYFIKWLHKCKKRSTNLNKLPSKCR